MDADNWSSVSQDGGKLCKAEKCEGKGTTELTEGNHIESTLEEKYEI